MRRAVWLSSLVACACVRALPPTEPPRPDPEVVLEPAGSEKIHASAPDPCAGLEGLVIDRLQPILSDWQGQVVVGGSAPVVVRWCGPGIATVASVTLVQPATERSDEWPLFIRELDPERAWLQPRASLMVEVSAPANPGIFEVVAVATDDHDRTHVARAPLESAEDPDRVAQRNECNAAGGQWGGHGMLGIESCDRPTHDAGQRCTSDADCESFCVDDGDEPIGASPPAGVEVPACGPGRQPRLLVGHCFERSLPFGCHARLRGVTIECIAPMFGRRAHTICVD